MEKRIRMWLKACLIVAGLLFFCFLAGRNGRGTDYEKEARIRQYEADESVEKTEITVLAYGEMIRKTELPEAASPPRDEDGQYENVVLTASGTYTYQTEETEAYLYRQATAYIRDNVILEVAEPGKQGETVLSNVWISEAADGYVTCFLNDSLFYLPCDTESENREQVADIILEDGEVKDCIFKKEKISGKLIGVTEEGITLPDREVPFSEDVRIYRLFGELDRKSVV